MHVFLPIILLALLSCIGNTCTNAFKIEPLPKAHVDQLTISDFKSIYLDSKPIILTGTTACPTKLDFENIHQYCRGNIPGNYVNKKSKSKRESKWAGLEEGDKRRIIDFNQWVDEMGSGKDQPEFMFDVPMAEVCPTLMSDVMIPGHFVGVFASQYKYRRGKSYNSDQLQLRGKANANTDGEMNNHNHNHNHKHEEIEMEIDMDMSDICTDLPFYNMYLAEESFQTDLHIDAGHSAFMASMCVGRKRWRVMTNADYAKAFSTIGTDGQLVNDTLVLGSLHSPFNTWNDNGDAEDFLLGDLNVTIYEGILEPGQLLYIPAGAPHAATTLDKSLMVASNDHSLKNLRDAVGYCDLVQDNHVACHDFRLKLESMEESLHFMDDFERIETSLPVSTGCEKTYELLGNLSQDGLLMITPENFRILIEEGPLIILKSQKNCGSCLFLLNSWHKIVQGFDPPVRFGVLHCFQGQCPFGEDELYLQVLERFGERSSPDFQFVRLRNANTLSFSDYFGFLSFDDLRVWASVHSGSSIDLDPHWWKRLLQFFHLSAAFFTTIVNTVGPMGLFFLVLTSFLVIMNVWDYFNNLLAKGVSRMKPRKSKEA